MSRTNTRWVRVAVALVQCLHTISNFHDLVPAPHQNHHHHRHVHTHVQHGVTCTYARTYTPAAQHTMVPPSTAWCCCCACYHHQCGHCRQITCPLHCCPHLNTSSRHPWTHAHFLRVCQAPATGQTAQILPLRATRHVTHVTHVTLAQLFACGACGCLHHPGVDQRSTCVSPTGHAR